MKRYISGQEIIESGKATILELAAHCESGKLQAFGPAGERVVNDTDCTLSPKTLDECRQSAEETFTKCPALFEGIACFDDEGDLILHPTPQQKISRLAEIFYQEGIQVYRPKDGTPRESVITFQFNLDRFISYCEQQRIEQNEIFYDFSCLQLPDVFRLEIEKKLLAIHGDRLYQGRPSRDIYHELFSRCIRSFLFKAEDIEKLFPCSSDIKINANTTAEKEKSKTRPNKKDFELTQEDAARALGCSVSTIRNYDRGIGAPKGYPGRKSWVSFGRFLISYRGERQARELAFAMNRALPGGDMAEYSDDDRTDFP